MAKLTVSFVLWFIFSSQRIHVAQGKEKVKHLCPLMLSSQNLPEDWFYFRNYRISVCFTRFRVLILFRMLQSHVSFCLWLQTLLANVMQWQAQSLETTIVPRGALLLSLPLKCVHNTTVDRKQKDDQIWVILRTLVTQLPISTKSIIPYVCVHTYIYMYVCIYIYSYMYVCVCD